MLNAISNKGELHPKLEQAIVLFMTHINLYNFRFFGEFGTYINYKESDQIPTAGVTYKDGKIVMLWNRKFLDSLPQEQATFLYLHEISHLLGNCHKRVEYNNLNHQYANIAHDMVINTSLINDKDLTDFIEMIPKGFVIPQSYDGDPILEPIYVFIREHDKQAQEQREQEQKPQNGQGQQQDQDDSQDDQQQDGNGGQGDEQEDKDGDQDDQGNGGQGDEEQDQDGNGGQGDEQSDQQGNGNGDGEPQEGNGGGSDNPLTDNVDNDIPTDENGAIGDMPKDKKYVEQGENGQTMDVHFDPQNQLEKDLLERTAKDIVDKLKNRGLVSSNVEKILDNLEKKPNNWLNQLKRFLTGAKGIGNYSKTFKKPNRYGIEGLRGKRKDAIVFDVVLDTSGSMIDDIPKVLGTIFRAGITCNIVQIDTQVQSDTVISSPKELSKLNLKGFGGTVLQPAIDYIVEKKQEPRPLVIMTDGYTDHLDVSGIRDKTVVLTTGVEPTITGGNITMIDCSLY